MITSPNRSSATRCWRRSVASLISQNQFSEALTSVNQLSSFKLSPDQQQLVEKLKEQIQKALAGQGAAKSIGNLIPGAK